ncbi:MAG: hypothetical protein ACTSXL_02405 [Alphaproteobacteria bacterium]
MLQIKLIFFLMIFTSFSLSALRPPSEKTIIEDEVFPDSKQEKQDKVSQETEPQIVDSTGKEEENIDEIDVPYEEFSEHSNEEPPLEIKEKSSLTLQSTVANPVATHPLLSLETTGTIFEQFAEFEKNKLLMTLQTDEEKLELERDKVKLQRLKVKKELAKFEGESSQNSEQNSTITQEEVEGMIAEKIANMSGESSEETSESPSNDSGEPKTFSEMYSVKTIMGIGKKLIAVLRSVDNSAKTRVKIGTEIEGYVVRKIKPKKGIVVEKNGKTEEVGIE